MILFLEPKTSFIINKELLSLITSIYISSSLTFSVAQYLCLGTSAQCLQFVAKHLILNFAAVESNSNPNDFVCTFLK